MTADRRISIGNWLVPYDDATTEVTLNRTLTDILTATPGDAQDCMNSRCIRAQHNEHAFPHPVLIVSTIKTRVYIVDRLSDDGMPAHAVRYELTKRDSALIGAHDRYGAGEPGLLRLRIPRDPKGSPIRAASSQNGRFGSVAGRYSGDGKAPESSRRPVTSIGAAARFKVAVGALRTSSGTGE